ERRIQQAAHVVRELLSGHEKRQIGHPIHATPSGARSPEPRAQATRAASAARALSKNRRPSTPERIAAGVAGPKPGSTACSGYGMSPTTLPASFVRPAMSSSDPLGFTPA